MACIKRDRAEDDGAHDPQQEARNGFELADHVDNVDRSAARMVVSKSSIDVNEFHPSASTVHRDPIEATLRTARSAREE